MPDNYIVKMFCFAAHIFNNKNLIGLVLSLHINMYNLITKYVCTLLHNAYGCRTSLYKSIQSTSNKILSHHALNFRRKKYILL